MNDILLLTPVFIPAAIYFIMNGWLSGILMRHAGRNTLPHRPSDFLPMVSVIVPVRNEQDNIIRILDELSGQDYPASRFEIMVADDHSDDLTVERAMASAGRGSGPMIKVIVAGSGGQAMGKKSAVERAVEQAQGEIILATDADTSRRPLWMRSMITPFIDPEKQMVLGPVTLEPACNLLQKIQAVEFMGIMGTTAASAEAGHPLMCNGANIAYRRQAFVETGGFREHLRYGSGDDQFLMAAVRKKYGRRSVFFNRDRDAIVSTAPECTFTGFIHQRIRWISKSRGYRDPAIIGAGLVAGLLPLMILGCMIAGLFVPVMLCVSGSMLLVKWIADFFLVLPMIRFFGRTNLLGFYIPAQLFQVFYVVLIAIPGLFLPYRWKGRNFRR